MVRSYLMVRENYIKNWELQRVKSCFLEGGLSRG
jgi:hypothetical protein